MNENLTFKDLEHSHELLVEIEFKLKLDVGSSVTATCFHDLQTESTITGASP